MGRCESHARTHPAHTRSIYFGHRRWRTGKMSVDTLSVGGLTATVTFGEMTQATLFDCATTDGVLGMGRSNSDGQNVFEDMVDVRNKAHAKCKTFKCNITIRKFTTRTGFPRLVLAIVDAGRCTCGEFLPIRTYFRTDHCLRPSVQSFGDPILVTFNATRPARPCVFSRTQAAPLHSSCPSWRPCSSGYIDRRRDGLCTTPGGRGRHTSILALHGEHRHGLAHWNAHLGRRESDAL